MLYVIIRYVGQVISEIDQTHNTTKHAARPLRPVIGFAPFGVLAARKALKRGGRINNVEVQVPDTQPAQHLNNNHNVFFLYDDESNSFGTELQLRGDFEGS